MKSQRLPATLILEDGTHFQGYAFGAEHPVKGEVVFNTGMIGYPESLTDPSYKGQILTFTYPLIGNYGVPGNQREDGLLRYFESDHIQIQGLIVSDYSDHYHHWNATTSLSAWMQEHNIPGITNIDTRALTKKLRQKGTMLGRIYYDTDEDTTFYDPNTHNLVAEVSITHPILYQKGKKRVILVDCGVKNNIIRAFLRRNISVLRCPWDYNFLNEDADGIVLSNGPGNPKTCQKTITHIRKLLPEKMPILGICLGAQLLALAAGANTYKLKYGHRSHNQPCLELGSNRCYITTQNHGYAVDDTTLPEDWRAWFINKNDESNEGLIHIGKPFFGAQFHPEASPGPDDTEFLFDMFLRAMR
jgi:carbamoyl-phosphate synthase small subunit